MKEREIEECYIIGSGPSLSQLTLGEIREIEKGFVIVCNFSYKIFKKVDAVCLLDGKIVFDYLKDVEDLGNSWKEIEKNMKCDIISPHYPKTLKEKYNLDIESGNGFKNKIVSYSTNTGYFALNFALHLSFKKYILVGFNCSAFNWVLEVFHSNGDSGKPLVEKINKDFAFAEDKVVNLRGAVSLIFPYVNTLDM